MTAEQAKDYAYAHLPCTMTSFETMLKRDLGSFVDIEKIIGMTPRSLGYGRIVFKFQFAGELTVLPVGVAEPVRLFSYMREWFSDRGFKIEREAVNVGNVTCSWWIKTPVDLKEDRRATFAHAR